MSREALKLALEALENAKPILIGLQTIGIKAGATSQAMRLGEQFIQDRAITAIKEVLAQQEHPEQMARLGWQCFECPACGSEGARAFPKPEQEPDDNGITVDLLERLKATLTKLGYATPEGGLEQFGSRLPTQLYNLCRAVDGLLVANLSLTDKGDTPKVGCVQHDCDECKQLREQNTMLDAKLAEIEAQPEQEPYGYFKPEPFGWVDCAETDEGAKALYEAPPAAQRTWVGLTHAELIEIYNRKDWDHPNSWEYEQLIEAKLKEKNA